VQTTRSAGSGDDSKAGGLTPTSYSILGLLALRDWSGYQIAKQGRLGLGQLWPRAQRQLYNDPKRLVDGGYATATAEQVGRRRRTIYSITRAGRAALKRWFATPARPPVLEFEAMVRVLFADQCTVAQLRSTIESIAEQARSARAEFADMAAHQVDGGGIYPTRFHTNALAMRFMIGHFTHLIDWSNWALDATRTWPDTKTPATTWAAEASAIFRDAARHGIGDDSEPAAAYER
jgi:PadR family transcriptional regulator, regulatory protein AphA